MSSPPPRLNESYGCKVFFCLLLGRVVSKIGRSSGGGDVGGNYFKE